MSTDEENLLANLEVHGAEFLKSFGNLGSTRTGSERDAKTGHTVCPIVQDSNDGEDIEDEWMGIDHEFEVCLPRESEPSTPEVIVFSDGASRRPAMRPQARTFLSSKVSKLKDSSPVEASEKLPEGSRGEEQDISNLQNDALLHRLIHTKLLSGSLNPDSTITPGQRQRAFQGRVLELTGDSKLGKGETVARRDEKNRANRRVRAGLMAKEKERGKKTLDEAKSAGNYHPTIKKLFAASSFDGQQRKRDRGLNMGIGRFAKGMLRLTSQDISSVRGTRSSHGRERGRGSKG